jgi:hypothetical protein
MSKRLDESEFNLFETEMKCACKKTYTLSLIFNIFSEKYWYNAVDGREFNDLVVLTSSS